MSPPRPYPGWGQTVWLLVTRGVTRWVYINWTVGTKRENRREPTRKADKTHRQQTTERRKGQSAQEADETVDAGKQAGLVKVKDNQKYREYRRSSDVQLIDGAANSGL